MNFVLSREREIKRGGQKDGWMLLYNLLKLKVVLH